MTLADLLEVVPPTGIDGLAFPRHLLGAFRRKSITFCTGLTDEQSVVYWFQSKSFTIDLRLPDGAATPVTDRQGWTGDTLWDDRNQQMSWAIRRSYQPRDQWPEPASFGFIGNSVLEYAPSGAYVEDWRQQAGEGPLLGLRLTGMRDHASGRSHVMDGGFVLAGPHCAFALSRLPEMDDALYHTGSLERAVTEGTLTREQIESHEVSVALDGHTVTHSTRSQRPGQPIAAGDFAISPDGGVMMHTVLAAGPCSLHFTLDVYVPAFTFASCTPSTAQAQDWMRREQSHLERHARIAR
jgi:hypothetical protein